MFLSIKKDREFKRVYSQGKYVSDNLFVVCACGNGLTETRVGIVVSKKVGGAVTRNRIKRWVKASFRTLPAKPSEGQGMDVIFIARAPVGQLCGKGVFAEVEKTVHKMFARARKRINNSKDAK